MQNGMIFAAMIAAGLAGVLTLHAETWTWIGGSVNGWDGGLKANVNKNPEWREGYNWQDSNGGRGDGHALLRHGQDEEGQEDEEDGEGLLQADVRDGGDPDNGGGRLSVFERRVSLLRAVGGEQLPGSHWLGAGHRIASEASAAGSVMWQGRPRPCSKAEAALPHRVPQYKVCKAEAVFSPAHFPCFWLKCVGNWIGLILHTFRFFRKV